VCGGRTMAPAAVVPAPVAEVETETGFTFSHLNVMIHSGTDSLSSPAQAFRIVLITVQ
jgi:hypothetical protein